MLLLCSNPFFLNGTDMLMFTKSYCVHIIVFFHYAWWQQDGSFYSLDNDTWQGGVGLQEHSRALISCLGAPKLSLNGVRYWQQGTTEHLYFYSVLIKKMLITSMFIQHHLCHTLVATISGCCCSTCCYTGKGNIILKCLQCSNATKWHSLIEIFDNNWYKEIKNTHSYCQSSLHSVIMIITLFTLDI